jgi:tetratricopeptide (TPR) repeat protein
MIRRIAPALRGLALAAALLASACRGDTVDAKNCIQHPNGGAGLESCSRAIASGRLSSSKLATALYNRGIAYLDRGDFDRAIADFDRVIELRPDTSKAFYNRAISYLRRGEFERAVKDFDRVVQLTPDYAPGFRNRGNAYRGLLAFDRAIQDYDQAIKLSPEYAVAFSNRGVAYMNKELYDRAIEDFDKVVRLKPDDGHSYRDRGSARRPGPGQGRRALARRSIRRDPALSRGEPRRRGRHRAAPRRRFRDRSPGLARAGHRAIPG